jgi:5-methylcytosine-specific restriction enzyme A
MSTSPRPFRRKESYEAERLTRDAVVPYLSTRGFTVLEEERTPVGEGESQIITALGQDGTRFKMRVRTCWTWAGKPARERQISAAQLMARAGDDWDAALENLHSRQQAANVSHFLLAQGDTDGIHIASLIPAHAIKPIWQRQRDVSIAELAAGNLGRKRKNHAQNGDSPTMYLKDERTEGGRRVAAVLWEWPGVVDLSKSLSASPRRDDTYDDLPDVDLSIFGSDQPPRKQTTRSEVQRDPEVRRQVAKRAVQGCERPGCADHRRYPGFLDVHHILGAEKSDRVWTCVALCPSCHREAHYGPNAAQLNDELLEFASRFVPAGK